MIGKINNAQRLSHPALRSKEKLEAKEATTQKQGAEQTKQSKLERISAEIANGTYKLDMSKTAKAVLESLS